MSLSLQLTSHFLVFTLLLNMTKKKKIQKFKKQSIERKENHYFILLFHKSVTGIEIGTPVCLPTVLI